MSSTRQRLTDAAVRRFYRDGFRNVGLDQILADVGISKTAFYKHFECKEDLVLAALETKNVWLQDTFRALVRQHGGESAASQLRGLLDVVDQLIDADEYQGCIFVNVAMEFPLPTDPAHVAAARHKQAIEDIVCDLAAQAGAADPRALARQLCLIMEGAYVTRQVTGNRETIEIARRVADLVLASHLECRQETTEAHRHREENESSKGEARR
jgi:AcrR family transcriptional regulator